MRRYAFRRKYLIRKAHSDRTAARAPDPSRRRLTLGPKLIYFKHLQGNRGMRVDAPVWE